MNKHNTNPTEGVTNQTLVNVGEGFNPIRKDDIDYINKTFSDFEKKLYEIQKKYNTDYSGLYFGTPLEMIKSILDDSLIDMLEDYLKQLLVKEEEEQLLYEEEELLYEEESGGQ